MLKHVRKSRVLSVLLSAMFYVSVVLSAVFLNPKNVSADVNNIRNPGYEPLLFDFYTSTLTSPTDYWYEGFEGFTSCTATVNSSCLNLNITGSDPKFYSADNINLDAAVYRYIKIKFKNSTAGTAARIYFITTADTIYDKAKSKGFTMIANDSNYTEYILDMDTVTTWTGTIKRIRTDIPDDVTSGSVSIDKIGFYNNGEPSDIEYLFDSGLQGFTSFVGCSGNVANSFLDITITGEDPNFRTPDNLNLDASKFKYIKIRMRNNMASTEAKVYFTTTADTTWNETKSKAFTIIANDSDYTDYLIDMNTVSVWIGTIKQIRIDPENGVASGTTSIDMIGIYTGSILPDISYNYLSSADGWSAVSGCSVSAAGGILTVSNSAADPQIASPDNLNLNAGQYKYVKVKMKNNTSCNFAQLYWTTATDPVFDERKSQKFIINENDSGYTEYITGLSQNQYWKGTIRRLRIKCSSYQNSGSTNIDYVVITQNADTTRQNWNVREGWILPPNNNAQFGGWDFGENGGEYIGHNSELTKRLNGSDIETYGGVGLTSCFNTDTQGWSAQQSCSLSIVNNNLRFTITGSDPAMRSADNLNIDAKSVRTITFSMKNNTSDTAGKIYFITNSDQTWNESKSFAVSLSANDTEEKTYYIDISSNPNWIGTIKRIRWDVVQNVSSGTVDVSSFKLDFDYALVVVDNRTDSNVFGQKTLPEQTKGILRWEFKFALDSAPMDGIDWRLADGIGGKDSDDVIKFVTSGDSLCYKDTDDSLTAIGVLTARKDYRVMVMVNMDTRRYDVWVDGVSKAAGKPFLNSKTKINKVYMGTTNANTCKANLTISLYKIGYIFDDFYSEPAGNSPIGYLTDGTSPQGAYTQVRGSLQNSGTPFSRTSGIDMYNSSDTQSYKIYKNFSDADGVIEYQTDFLLPVKMDNITFALGQGATDGIVVKTSGGASGSLNYMDSSGANQKLWDNYKANVWYTLMVRANVITNKATYYINGIPCAADVPFRNAVTALNRLRVTVPAAGHLYVNYVRVAPSFPTTIPYIDAVNNPDSGYVGMQAWQLFTSTYETYDKVYNKIKQADKTPYLGFMDELTPEAIDWQIKYLAEHGVDFINQFYYRPYFLGAGQTPPEITHRAWLDTYLERCPEMAGKIKFSICISCESMNYFGTSEEFLSNFIPYLTERYFKNPNYLKYGNKPVVLMYNAGELVKKYGGESSFNSILNQARSWVAGQKDSQGNSLAGLIFIAEARPITITDAKVQSLKNAGFDFLYGYANGTSIGNLQNWKSVIDANGMKAIASPGNMWDNRYWYPSDWQQMKTPPDFYNLNKYVKNTFLPSYPSSSLASKMVLFDNWSEFGEGHSILPTNQYGFKWLDAIRDVFTAVPKVHNDVKPDSTYDALYTKAWKKQILKNYDFEKGTQNWYTTSATLSSVTHTEEPYAGGDYDSLAVSCSSRSGTTSDIGQFVTSEVLRNGNGKVYELSAFIKTASGEKNAILYVETSDDTGTHWFTINGKADSSKYTNIRGDVMISWTGKLNYAKFKIRGNSTDTGAFYADDCSMKCLK